jgi:membrane protease YdiL (CAAX protease family)
MTDPRSIDIADSSRVPSFRDVPWRWRDVAIGLVPAIAIGSLPLILSPEAQYVLPRWSWIGLAVVELGWILAYPLWVAGRRSGVPSPLSARRLAIEAFIALLAVSVLLVVESVAFTILTQWLGTATSLSEFEAIAAAPEPYQGVTLVVLAVVFAPLAEEVLFRGLLYNLLRARMHFLAAALIQGVVFALAHPFGLIERAMIVVTGISLALLYQWRKTLAAPILFHALFNAASMAMIFASVAIAANAPVLGVGGKPDDKGCIVTVVTPGSAADEAGIRVGDVITAAGENSVRNIGDLILIVRTKQVGDRIPVWFRRGEQDHQVEAVLKPRPK